MCRSHRCCSHETNRLIEGTEQNITTSGKIGGELEIMKNAPWLNERLELFNKYFEEYTKSVAGSCCVLRADALEKPREEITITLPDGAVKTGTSWETTPLMIAESISKGLAQHVVSARVGNAGGVRRRCCTRTRPRTRAA